MLGYELGRIAAGADGGSAAYLIEELEDLVTGQPCGDNTQCASGFCADYRCCNVACGGDDVSDCQACSIAAGAMVDGQCAPLAANTTCRESSGACGQAEVRDGADAACPADVGQPLGSPGMPSCAPYVCSGPSFCITSCNIDDQCIAGYVCTAHTCVVDPTTTSAGVGGGGAGMGGTGMGGTGMGGTGMGGAGRGGTATGGIGAGGNGMGGSGAVTTGGAPTSATTTSTGSGGATDAGTEDGCGCRVGAAPSRRPAWYFAALGALLLYRRRRLGH